MRLVRLGGVKVLVQLSICKPDKQLSGSFTERPDLEV
jgi:hypothetical protein